MTSVVDQSAWWNALLTSEIFTWHGGTAIYIYNKRLAFMLTILSFFIIYNIYIQVKLGMLSTSLVVTIHIFVIIGLTENHNKYIYKVYIQLKTVNHKRSYTNITFIKSFLFTYKKNKIPYILYLN